MLEINGDYFIVVDNGGGLVRRARHQVRLNKALSYHLSSFEGEGDGVPDQDNDAGQVRSPLRRPKRIRHPPDRFSSKDYWR